MKQVCLSLNLFLIINLLKPAKIFPNGLKRSMPRQQRKNISEKNGKRRLGEIGIHTAVERI